MRRIAVALVLSALVSSACASQLGRSAPYCSDSITAPSGEVVMQAQAAQQARFGPCLDDLPSGWEYDHQEHKLGEARFWLDSDRMGERFVTVRLLDSCDVGDAVRAARDPHPEVERYVTERFVGREVPVVVIPLGDRPEFQALRVQVLLDGQEIDDRVVDVELADPSSPLEVGDLRDAALAAGAIVLVVDELDVDDDTVTLIRRRGAEPKKVKLDDVLDEISEDLPDVFYRGTWYHLFDNGCIIYDIDAEGPEADTVAADVDRALGFYNLEALRDYGRSQGFEF